MASVEWNNYLARGVHPGKRAFVGGNWKMQTSMSKAESIVETLNSCGAIPANVEVVVAPPSLQLMTVKGALRPEVSVSLQNTCVKDGYAAATGEISPAMATDAGIQWVILGHSERRAGFGTQEGESDELVATKCKVAIDGGMSVIACIGEQLEDRQAERTLEVVLNQNLAAIASKLTPADYDKVVIAYEPVWAIGTGLTASPQQAQEVHAAIRKWLVENVSVDVAKAMRIIYGGSVKAANCEALSAEPDIDGFLVGGASLKPEFVEVFQAAAAGLQG